jgi:hypothetical protein
MCQTLKKILLKLGYLIKRDMEGRLCSENNYPSLLLKSTLLSPFCSPVQPKRRFIFGSVGRVKIFGKMDYVLETKGRPFSFFLNTRFENI